MIRVSNIASILRAVESVCFFDNESGCLSDTLLYKTNMHKLDYSYAANILCVCVFL